MELLEKLEFSILDFYEILRKEFDNEEFDQKIRSYTDLQIEPFFDLLEDNDDHTFEFEKSYLPFWTLFENGWDFDGEDVLTGFISTPIFKSYQALRAESALKRELLTSEEEIYVLCDDSFKTRMVLKGTIGELSETIDRRSDTLPYMTLGGPFDHIFYIPHQKKVIIVNHEGGRTDIPLPLKEKAR